MMCPICHQRASSFSRYLFSKQGVSIIQNAKGFLTCQHCGTLLHVVRFGKQMWFYFVSSVVILAFFAVFYKHLIVVTGKGLFTIVWICLASLIMVVYAAGLWHYGIVEKAEEETTISRS